MTGDNGLDDPVDLARGDAGPDGAAATAFPVWSAAPWRDRVAVMRRLSDILDSRKYDLGIAALLEVGKSHMEAIGEAEEAVDLVSFYCDEMERNEGFARPMNRALDHEETRDVLRPANVLRGLCG